MAKTIIVFGYGPGISDGVAHKFGKEGFNVALVGRTQSKLDAGVKELEAKGVKAKAFTADLNDVAAVKSVVGKVREAFGPISAIEWTAYQIAAGDLLTASATDIASALGIATSSLVAAVQASLADLEAEKGAVLVTNGGFGLHDPNIDGMLVQYKSAGMGIANAAKRKVVGVLHAQLKDRGVYVAEVLIQGIVKGTAWDDGKNPKVLEPAAIGDHYFKIFGDRKDWSTTFGGGF